MSRMLSPLLQMTMLLLLKTAQIVVGRTFRPCLAFSITMRIKAVQKGRGREKCHGYHDFNRGIAVNDAACEMNVAFGREEGENSLIFLLPGTDCTS